MDDKIQVSLHVRPLDLEMTNLDFKVLSKRAVGYTGCYLYTLEILKSDREFWKELMCVPYTFVVNRIMTNDEEREILKMMKAQCHLCFGKPLATIDYDIICVSDRSDPNITIFQPMYQDEWIYISKKESFKYDYDFTPLVGCGYIGDSLLHVICSYEFPTAFWFRDLCVYDLAIVDPLSYEVLEDRLAEVDSQVRLMRDSGYVTYTNASHFDLLRERAKSWDLTIEEMEYPRYDYFPLEQTANAKTTMTIVPTKFLLVKSNLMSNCVFSSWLRENIQRVLLGQKARLLNITTGTSLPGGIYVQEI